MHGGVAEVGQPCHPDPSLREPVLAYRHLHPEAEHRVADARDASEQARRARARAHADERAREPRRDHECETEHQPAPAQHPGQLLRVTGVDRHHCSSVIVITRANHPTPLDAAPRNRYSARHNLPGSPSSVSNESGAAPRSSMSKLVPSTVSRSSVAWASAISTGAPAAGHRAPYARSWGNAVTDSAPPSSVEIP